MNGESRPRQAAPADATPAEDTTLHELPMFAWHQCRRHPWLGVSVLVVPDAPPLCIGPEATHWAGVAA